MDRNGNAAPCPPEPPRGRKRTWDQMEEQHACLNSTSPSSRPCPIPSPAERISTTPHPSRSGARLPELILEGSRQPDRSSPSLRFYSSPSISRSFASGDIFEHYNTSEFRPPVISYPVNLVPPSSRSFPPPSISFPPSSSTSRTQPMASQMDVIDLTNEPDSPVAPSSTLRYGAEYGDRASQTNTQRARRRQDNPPGRPVAYEVIDIDDDDVVELSSVRRGNSSNPVVISGNDIPGDTMNDLPPPNLPHLHNHPGSEPRNMLLPPLPPPSISQGSYNYFSAFPGWEMLGRSLPGMRSFRRPTAAFDNTHSFGQRDSTAGNAQSQGEHDLPPRRRNAPRGSTRFGTGVINPAGSAASRFNPFSADFAPPFNLDFESIAFTLGSAQPLRPPRRPQYTAPEPAPEGFTRSPRDDMVVVCCKCEGELGVGDSDLKRQVWAIRSCGHVYCGECAKNRSKKTKANIAANNYFTKCVVEGCHNTKIGGGKGMIQLYL